MQFFTIIALFAISAAAAPAPDVPTGLDQVGDGVNTVVHGLASVLGGGTAASGTNGGLSGGANGGANGGVNGGTNGGVNGGQSGVGGITGTGNGGSSGHGGVGGTTSGLGAGHGSASHGGRISINVNRKN
ncbi:hypothetical protein HGRIS_014052 [Hohenbuehelia grisea]|uniref:Uncharacterized protein n=1 Tax=Hohenbuehelia grisea TaxID=104357 RepID=A0ABR3JSH9_9AGAR